MQIINTLEQSSLCFLQELTSSPYSGPNESSLQTLVPHFCHVCDSAPSISLWFRHPKCIWRRVKVLKLLVLQLSAAFCYFVGIVMVLFTVHELNVEVGMI
jgi:hypothetical protein